MKKNIGSADSIIRLIVAAVFAILFFTKTVTGTPGIILIVLAVVFAVTAIVRFCPLYLPFNISSCKKQ